MANIFMTTFFTEMLLPFLLIFVVVFAILQKAKILGEGKAQIDAMVALVVGLILIGVPGPRNFVVGIMPWLAVGVAVIFVFLVLYGFVAGDLSKMGDVHKWVKPTFAVIAALFTIGVVLYVSGFGDIIVDWFSGGAGESELLMNIVMIVVVIGVVALVVVGGKSGSDGEENG